MKKLIPPILCFLLLSVFIACSKPKANLDPELLAEITKIKAIDNHAHPERALGEGEQEGEYDIDPIACLSEGPPLLRLRANNPEFIAAWQSIYGYPYKDTNAEHVRVLTETKLRIRREQGEAFPAWVLDKLGIETMLTNRLAKGRGLVAPRFQWVSFVDALLFPLNNQRMRKANSEAEISYGNEEKTLKRYLAEAGLNNLPATFDGYLDKVVTATLEREKRDGAVAVKFEVGYLRPLDFADAPEGEAKRIYTRYVSGGEPSASEYKTLQDFLFRYIAREAGRIGLVVHIHVTDGCGIYYDQDGSNPLRLTSAFNDPTLRKTRFILLHGGWPFDKQVASLLSKPNVYADFSGQTFRLYPQALSEMLRTWLERYPEKVLYGSDTGPFSPPVGWEDLGWLTLNTTRQALALALTGMMNDGEITREQALEFARLVLRDNAIKLYGMKTG